MTPRFPAVVPGATVREGIGFVDGRVRFREVAGCTEEFVAGAEDGSA